MEISDIRRKNLEELISQFDSAADFAEASEMDTSHLSQLRTGRRNIGGKLARKIETANSKPKGWMDSITLELHTTTHAHETAELMLSSEKITSIKGRVPLISWVQAGDFCEAIDNFQPGDAEEWLPSPFEHSDSTFCLTVTGESMSPDYREGEIICVDPSLEWKHGDDVVARTPDGKVTFKRLQITPDGDFLKALNPDWPKKLIEMPEDIHICGVVIGSWMRRR